MNYHFRSHSEHTGSHHQQQQSVIRVHSDSQKSLDRLFNPPANEASVPLRQRNLPSSFFNPRKTSLHMRSTSYDPRQHNSSGSEVMSTGCSSCSGLVSSAGSLHQQVQYLDSSPAYVAGDNNIWPQHLSANGQPYPNSLSDGRQNSSSLSDSLGSPETNQVARAEPQYEYRVPAESNYPLNQQQQQQPDYTFQSGHQQQHCPVIASSEKSFISSRSVENINHDGLFVDNYHHHNHHNHNHHHHHHHQQQQQLPYVQAQPPPSQAAHHPGAFYNNNNGYPQPAEYPINEQQYQQQQFNQPASQARVALNPPTTIGRRFQPGLGNIYAEDSSSVITENPSLARTSSSLSFAPNPTQQPQQQPPPIRAKPLIDPSGRMLNDYTRSSFPNNGAPPV